MRQTARLPTATAKGPPLPTPVLAQTSTAPTAPAATTTADATVVDTCNQCHHTITRTATPWDKAWHCSEGCSCAMMIGCVPVRATRTGN